MLLKSAAIAICAILSIQMLRVYLRKRRIRDDFDSAMRVIAKEAVKVARKGFKVDLDFSPSSIDCLEGMLGKIRERHLQEPLSDKELEVQSLRWGAYIGEVAKRMRPGKWRRDSEKARLGAIPLVFDDGLEAFPCSWVYKRIADGPEDNIIFKFQMFSDSRLRELVGKANPQ